jgi:hypothetical protein
MNFIIGKIGAAVTGISVLAFAISMIIGLTADSLFASCLISIFIAIGFVPFMCSILAINKNDDIKAVGYSGIAFAVIYAVIICLVYYAECTTVRLNASLSNEALSIISFGYTGSLFFNFDLLGYAFMSLSTFLIAFTVEAETKCDKIFKWMLWIHGIFFLSCFLVPLFPIFTEGTDNIIGTIILEFWCIYFAPVCILGFRYFQRKKILVKSMQK